MVNCNKLLWTAYHLLQKLDLESRESCFDVIYVLDCMKLNVINEKVIKYHPFPAQLNQCPSRSLKKLALNYVPGVSTC